jgi:hypothetical protein
MRNLEGGMRRYIAHNRKTETPESDIVRVQKGREDNFSGWTGKGAKEGSKAATRRKKVPPEQLRWSSGIVMGKVG